MNFHDQNTNIVSLTLKNSANLPSAATQETSYISERIKLPIESKIVHNLEIISCKNILEFGEIYLSRLKKAEILPEYGIVVADNELLIKESSHMKFCHISLFNSCIQEITDGGALIFTPKALPFEEENCIYIGSNRNYYHWLVDELPRLSLIETNKQYTEAPILIDKKTAKWQYDFLAMLGVEKNRLRAVDFGRPISFKNLIVPSRLSRYMVAHPQAIAFMRRKLLSTADDLKVKEGKRVYIMRTAHTTTGRTMLNEKNVIRKY